MNAETLKDALASGSVDRIRETARLAVSRLRKAEIGDPIALGQLLLPLAAHPDPKLRELVATACGYLPPPMGEAELEALLEDADPFTKRAALRSAELRDDEESIAQRSDALDELSNELFSQLKPAARKIAERASRKREAYVVGQLYHQLSNITTPLKNALGRIRDEASKKTPNRETILNDVELAIDRLALQWSVIVATKAYTETVTPRFRDEPLARLVDEAFELLGDGVLGGRRVRFVNEIDERLSAEVDRELLSQAIQNVLKNGVEAYAEGADERELHVAGKLQRGGSRVVLSFTDRGAGMSPEHLEMLFVPYRSRKPNGTGLGMGNIRKMVSEVHGGRLEVHSRLGEGTTITFHLRTRQRGAKKRAAS
jgi:signal transduction histidine kinase